MITIRIGRPTLTLSSAGLSLHVRRIHCDAKTGGAKARWWQDDRIF